MRICTSTLIFAVAVSLAMLGACAADPAPGETDDTSTPADSEVGSDNGADIVETPDAGNTPDVPETPDGGTPDVPEPPVGGDGETCEDAAIADLSNLPTTLDVDNTDLANDYSPNGCGVTTSGADLVYSLTPDVDGYYTFEYAGEGPDLLYVVTDCADTATTCLGLTDFGDDASLEVALDAGQTYFLIVDGTNAFDEEAGTIGVSWRSCTDVCTDAAVRCNGDAIETCGTSAAGCLDWSGTTNCADDGSTCKDGANGPECAAAIPGDLCASAAEVVLGEAVSGNTDELSDDYSFPDGACAGVTGGQGAGFNDVTYVFTAPSDQTFHIELTKSGTNFDSALYVVTDCGDIDNTCLAGVDDGFNSEAEMIDLALTAGQTVYIVIDGATKASSSGESGDYELVVHCGPSEDTVCVEGVTDKVYGADACGVPTEITGNCTSALSCEVNNGDGQAYCACPLTGENTCKLGGALSNLYEETFIAKERACASNVPDPTDFIEDCGFGTVCFQDPEINDNVPLCHRSIDASQSDKPYYDFGCGQFIEWLQHPTNLEIDCRCRTTGDGQGGAGGTIGTGNGYVGPVSDPPYYPGGPVINCAPGYKMAEEIWPVAYGSGPNFNSWAQNSNIAQWFSGIVNPVTREMFSVVKWTNVDYVHSASIAAWNLDTGARRVVTGLHPDPQAGMMAYGSGYMSPKPGNTGTVTEQPLSGATVVRWGPDGMLYTFGGSLGQSTSNTREIVRTDPTTGERTLVWLSQDGDVGDLTATYGQCFRPDAYGNLESISLQGQAFEVGPDGTFYVSMHGIREGDGIIAISADATTCTPLSRWGGTGHAPGGGTDPVPAPTPIGSGLNLQFPTQGLLYHEGLIYGVSNDDLYSFDPATGNRLLMSYTAGTYGGMGFSNMFWDPTRDVIWAVGTVAPEVGSIVDLSTGKREPVYGDSEWGDDAIIKSIYGTAQSTSNSMLSNGNNLHYGGVVLDPDNNDIVYGVLDTGGLMKLELSTFNNYVMSW